MSAFDVRKEIRERRLREAAEQKRDEPQPSAPPEAQIIRPLRPPSARSSGQDFGDAESYQIHSEPDEEWYQDETQEGKHEQRENLPKIMKNISDNPTRGRKRWRWGRRRPAKLEESETCQMCFLRRAALLSVVYGNTFSRISRKIGNLF